MPNEKPPKTDWSFVTKALEDAKEKKRAKMPPEELAEEIDKDNKEKEATKRALQSETPEEKEIRQQEIEKRVSEMYADIIEKSEEIRRQNYERAKLELEKLRKEHNIQLSEKEIEIRDQELRKKLGIE